MRVRLCVAALIVLGSVTFFLVSMVIQVMEPHVELPTPGGEDFFTARLLRADGPGSAYRTELCLSGDSKVITLLDTGSDALWVRKTKQDGGIHNSTEVDFHVAYMAGKAYGVVRDTKLSILNYTWSQPLGLVHKTEEGLKRVDSVLGLGTICHSNSKETCPLVNWKLRTQVFSFYMDPGTGEGLFQAGIVDETRCDHKEKLVYTKLLTDKDLLGIWTVKVSFLGMHNLRAVLDTGTTDIFMKVALYNKFIGAIGGHCSSSSLPTLALTIDQKDYPIPSSMYASTPSFRECRLRVHVLEERFPEDLLIGAAFLVNYFVVFDSSNERVGLCRPHSSPQFLLSVPPSIKEFFSLGS